MKVFTLVAWLQVASFCHTSVGAELLQAGFLPIGATQQESELLLQQTSEAQALDLKVTGVESELYMLQSTLQVSIVMQVLFNF